jgi:hypothetical protein
VCAVVFLAVFNETTQRIIIDLTYYYLVFMNKSIFMTFILVFLLVLSEFPILVDVDAYKTIVVPDDYPLIQDAIDAATDGDTIFVKN